MARVKISEYQAKSLLLKELGLPYQGWALSNSNFQSTLKELPSTQNYVVKVDQGIKKRAKNKLLMVNASAPEILEFIEKQGKAGYGQFIVEPYLAHKESDEKYLALERVREGVKVSYGEQGGVEIEANWDQVREGYNDFRHKNAELELLVKKLILLFNKYHLTLLEINPLLIINNRFYFLDLAVEVDDAALSLPELAKVQLKPIAEKVTLPSEMEIKLLDANTPASLKYRIINPHGRIWMLLSGGGASLVLADEVADQGLGKELANYGEYSGSPTTEDTYLYTRVLLRDLLSAKVTNKVLIIAGGVANFTDVAKTFTGIIRALSEVKTKLQAQEVKVFVRRGGPNQARGLKLMADFLKENGLYGEVLGPEKPLTEIVNFALQTS